MVAIKHRYSDATLCEFDVTTVREAAEKGKANLYGANLGGADLGGANLGGADLGGANLYGANLGDKGKVLADGFFLAGPTGSRKDTLLAFHTDKGIFIKAGCFFDSLDAFRAAVAKTHGDSNYAAYEYLGLCTFIEHHFAAAKESK